MRITRIIGIIVLLVGLGLLVAFSGETAGLLSSIVVIVLGLILTFLNRQGRM